MRTFSSLVLLFLAACGTSEPPAVDTEAAEVPDPTTLEKATSGARQALFGDLHVHTTYSFDAFIFGTRATPDDAYRYAKGETIKHPVGFDVQLNKPLDFYAVTDHAVFLGMLPAMHDPEQAVSQHELSRSIAGAETIADRRTAFLGMRPLLGEGGGGDLLDLDVVRSAWEDIQAAAERHNDPGNFTTFIAYEYTSGPDSQNLHRNVIFDGSEAPDIPFSRIDSANPEKLWAWMDDWRARGVESLAIPHNSNGSNGQMFALVDFAGGALDAEYAATRLRNEPLVEISQVKGTSDTHPLHSPNDEWADFEIMPYRIATWIDSDPNGSYVRQALRNGIALQAGKGFNPYQFGIIAASDTHNGAPALEEDNYFSKVGLIDGTAQRRGSVPLDEPDADGNEYANVYYDTWGASGVAGVWAEANTRKAIYAAFRRKETFGTSGPRIAVRAFAGFRLPMDLHTRSDMAEVGYQVGVAIGGDLLPGEGNPIITAKAMRDPASAALARLQVIKGWVADGETHEQVYDIACSDGLAVDPTSHRCPDNGARVDITSCATTPDVGAGELAATWQDPEFDPTKQAFYYVRVLENPTCRWSTWDAVRAGVAPKASLSATIQERAWSSPIWYHPE